MRILYFYDHCVVIQNYCNASTTPIAPNTNIVNPNTTLGSQTTLNCADGYSGAGIVFLRILSYNAYFIKDYKHF